MLTAPTPDGARTAIPLAAATAAIIDLSESGTDDTSSVNFGGDEKMKEELRELTKKRRDCERSITRAAKQMKSLDREIETLKFKCSSGTKSISKLKSKKMKKKSGSISAVSKAAVRKSVGNLVCRSYQKITKFVQGR